MDLVIEMSISEIISDRPRVSQINNGAHNQLDSGTLYGNRNSVLGVLETIKKEGKATFQVRWNPSADYQSKLTNLTKSKDKHTFFFKFFIKDDGTVRWSTQAEARGAKVKNAGKSGRGTTAQQVLDIACDSFDYQKGQDHNIDR